MASMQHVGLIPDGTRRWSRRYNVPLEDAYLRALTLMCSHTATAFELGANAVSLYLLSKPNLQRQKSDLDPYIAAGMALFRDLLPALCSDWSARPCLAGDPTKLPTALAPEVEQLLSRSGGDERRLYLCAPYDPDEELAAAAGKWKLASFKGHVRDYLWVPEPLDLVIRTGGATTLSNFLPLQCGYAQVTFLEELFNELTPEAFRWHLDAHLAKEVKRGV